MRLRRLAPWLILFEMLKAGRAHWDQLDPADRAEVADLMRRTHGNPRRLTAADRAQLSALAPIRPAPSKTARHGRRELLDRDPAAERHGRAAHGPCAQRLGAGLPHP